MKKQISFMPFSSYFHWMNKTMWMQLESSSNKKHIACCVMTCNDLQWHVQIFELFLYSCMLVTKCTTLWDDVNPYVLHNQYQTEYLDCISFQVNVFCRKWIFLERFLWIHDIHRLLQPPKVMRNINNLHDFEIVEDQKG